MKTLAGPRESFGDLAEVLVPGSGPCLDVGCGDGRHRALIEQAGYRWIGFDLRYSLRLSMLADALHLPFERGSCKGVVSWQSLEHFPRPWRAIEEMSRVLVTGGYLFGSTSFLEPFHDHSFFNFSELGLRELLADSGFEVVDIQPGISCFPLIGWTLLSRIASGRLATPTLNLIGGTLSFVNWIYPVGHRAYFGLTGSAASHIKDSYWFSRAPYDFAGHLIFRARKVTG